MNRTLSDAIDAMCTTERGFYFNSADSSVTDLNYQQLREIVHSLARKLIALGNKPGDAVIIAIPDQAQFIQVFLSVIRAGLVAVPIYPPSLIGDLASYCTDLERMRKITEAKYILTSDALQKQLKATCTITGLVSWSEIVASDEGGELPTSLPSDPALIQFTSGSTGSPKGVELSHSNLVHNAMGIQQSLALDPVRDRGVSWLPLHHDMGLIGFLVTPVMLQASNWFLPPLEFVRQPRRWLELMSQTQATISYAPNFGYDLAARSARAVECEKWDLSAWRVAGCGGEPIMSDVLDRFVNRLEPAGFNHTAFVPSYGLAEATVAVTVSPLDRGVLLRNTKDTGGHTSNRIVLGHPVKDTEVRIVSSKGDVLTDGLEGEIQVRGPGVAQRFWHDSGTLPASNHEGWLSTVILVR